MGPTRYCGTMSHTAVYQVRHDVDRNVTAPPPIQENVTVFPNITFENVTDVPPPEIPGPKEPLLQFTLAEHFQQSSDSDTYFLEPDVARLLTGRRYRVCTDLDGDKNSRLQVGDTGLSVYLSPVTAVFPKTLESTNKSQQLLLQCGYDGCARARLRSAYLATACGGSPARADASVCLANFSGSVAQEAATDAGEVELHPDGTATISLDTQCLPPGHEYRLCLVPRGEHNSEVVIGEDSGYSVTLVPGSLVAYD